MSAVDLGDVQDGSSFSPGPSFTDFSSDGSLAISFFIARTAIIWGSRLGFLCTENLRTSSNCHMTEETIGNRHVPLITRTH